jgi:MFS family permease
MNAETVGTHERAPAPRRPPVGGLLRTRNFGLFWVGESASGFGSAITTVALPLVAVSTLHASTSMVALLTAVTWLPFLVIGLPAGAWVDRWPRRRVLLTADLVSAVALAAIPIAAWTGVLTIGVLLAAALLSGVAKVFFDLAYNAFLPQLVAPEDLLEGNSKLQTSAAAAELAGPGLGGLLAQVAGTVCGVLVDALTFVVSAICLAGLRVSPEAPRDRVGEHGMFRQIAEGFGFIRRESFLVAMTAMAATGTFAMMGLTALRVVYLVRTEGASPGTVGLLIGAVSLGGILGAVLASRVVRRFGNARAYLVSNLAIAPFILLLPASGPGWRLSLFAAGSFVVLTGSTVSNVITATFRGTYVPVQLLGRVTASSRFLVFGTGPLGAVTAGALATAFGIRAAMWTLAVVFALTRTLPLATSIRGLRSFPAYGA